MEDGSAKTFFVGWVVGFICAALLVERWHRVGSTEPTEAPAAGETNDQSPVARAREASSRFRGAVFNGMKADVQRIQAVRPANWRSPRKNEPVGSLDDGGTGGS